MGRASLPDDFDVLPGALEAGPLACWLHVAGLLYCRRNLSDGFLHKNILPTLVDWSGVQRQDSEGPRYNGQPEWVDVDTHALADRLVRTGLWTLTVEGYLLRDYLSTNPAKQDVLEERAALRKRQATWREKRKQAPEAGPVLVHDGHARVRPLDATGDVTPLALDANGVVTPRVTPLALDATGYVTPLRSDEASASRADVEGNTGVASPEYVLAPELEGVLDPVLRSKEGVYPPPEVPPFDSEGGKFTPPRKVLQPRPPRKGKAPLPDPEERAEKRAERLDAESGKVLVGNRKVQMVIDEARRLHPGIQITVGDRNARAITHCGRPAVFIARAYVAAKERRWGSRWLQENMSLWAVIQVLDSFNDPENPEPEAPPRTELQQAVRQRAHDPYQQGAQQA